MSKELVCPFCNKKLEPIGTSGQFQCGSWVCDASFNFIAPRYVWEYIDRTRKALDVARHTIGWINQMIDEHADKQAIKIKCEYAIDKITALTKGGDNE